MRDPVKMMSLRFLLAAVPLGGAFATASTASAAAEVDLPRESPAARVFQQVGLTDIEVEYGSPAVKGRGIWGGVVPFDKPWTISPNQPTTIRFSKDVEVAGKSVPAGRYRLSALPGKTEWTLLFDKGGGAPGGGHDAHAEGDAIRVKVRPKAAPPREHLTFVFADFSDDKATLDLEWAKLRVSIPIATNTTQQVLAGIEELDDAWRSYANAARYMLETRKDFDAGLKYADRSLALKEDWYTYWIKATLLAAKHDYKGAVVQGERAYELGQKLGDGFTLEPELNKALADWKKRP
jgi:hypothetical protein